MEIENITGPFDTLRAGSLQGVFKEAIDPHKKGAAMNTIYPEEISAAAGMLLSLGCSYLPGLKDWFAGLEPTRKRLVMLALLAVSTLGIFALSCARPGWLPGVACSNGGAWELARIFVVALIANQTAFEVSPKTPARPTGLADVR